MAGSKNVHSDFHDDECRCLLCVHRADVAAKAAKINDVIAARIERTACTCYAALMDGKGCPVHDKKPPLRSYNSAERKAMPLWSFLSGYFPDAMMALCRLSKKANDKHNPGEPMHWARGKSMDQMECAQRHLLTPYEIDPETGEEEIVAAAWRLLAEIQFREERRLIAHGIRPLSGKNGLEVL